MNRRLLFLLLLCSSFTCWGHVLTGKAQISCTPDTPEMRQEAAFLQEYITGLYPLFQWGKGQDASIFLQLDDTLVGAEAYRLTITDNQTHIEASTTAGIFYGIQALRQRLPIDTIATQVELEPYTEEAAPRFPYRGLMLDCARHYFPVSFIHKFIDLLALHRMNRFHWHLTDNQGWRIEVKSHPELTAISSQGLFYTQEECQEIVEYAAMRHITVIPEIDMPGHEQAAIDTYPWLSCQYPDALCIDNPKTLDFVRDVLSELLSVFPSEYIHVGGDECPIQDMKALSDFTREVEAFLQAHGRKMIGWDETLAYDLSPQTTIMTWRDVAEGLKAVREHHDVIMAPGSHCYFDGYQSKEIQYEPLAIGGYLPVSRVYDFEPVPDTLSQEEASHIIGVQANLWTEYIATPSHAEYMLLPRTAALEDVQWRKPGQKDYAAFLRRLPHLFDLYDRLGYHYATHVFDVSLQTQVDTSHHCTQVSFSAINDNPVYYTLDGTDPVPGLSSRYEGKPLCINSTCTLKAMSPRSANQPTRIKCLAFDYNLATAQNIQLSYPPHPRYTFAGATTLVDGLCPGNTAYGSGAWLGWCGTPMIATIDVGKMVEASTLSLNAIVLPNSWIFAPERVAIEVSTDGLHYKEIAARSFNPATSISVNEVLPIELSFPKVNARYFRVTAMPLQSMPAWHNGAGQPAFIFVDEIKITSSQP